MIECRGHCQLVLVVRDEETFCNQVGARTRATASMLFSSATSHSHFICQLSLTPLPVHQLEHVILASIMQE